MGPVIGINKANPDFDERREIFRLLQRLPAQRRTEWLTWCCRTISKNTPYVQTVVKQSTGEVGEVYWDAMALLWDRGLELAKAGERLEQMIRGKV